MGRCPVPREMVERKTVWADAQIWGMGGGSFFALIFSGVDVYIVESGNNT
jgi:hypothetical protein